jgi:tetratricopeptide (TPR) repeat protein
MDEEAAARVAMDDGDYSHAAEHLAHALAREPTAATLIVLLDRLAAEAPGEVEDLIPIEDGEPWFGTVALHAGVLARRGEVARAFDLLCQVASVRPDIPYLEWAQSWFTREEFVPLDAVCDSLSRLLGPALTDGPPTVFAEALAAVAPLESVHPEDPDFLTTRSVLARRAGLLDQAVLEARRAVAHGGDTLAAVALANAYRARGEVAEAVQTLEAAAGHAEDPVPVRVELANLLLEARRPERAAPIYAEVIGVDPGHPWATPSLLFARFLATGDLDAREQLQVLAEDNRDNPRATSLAATVCPWVGFVPPPGEASIAVMARLAANSGGEDWGPEETPTFTIRVSFLEAASTTLAANLLARRLHPRFRIAIEADEVQTPDPRQTTPGVEPLWKWEEDGPHPALPPPDPEVARRIAVMATAPYHLPRWKAAATRIAAALNEGQEVHVLAAAVQPPEAPPSCVPWMWVRHVQLAAALVLAARSHGDAGSAGWEALERMARGPADWSTSAGIVALTDLALDHPRHLDQVRSLLLQRLQEAPAQGYWCLDGALVHSLLRLPNLGSTERDLLRERRRRWWTMMA